MGLLDSNVGCRYTGKATFGAPTHVLCSEPANRRPLRRIVALVLLDLRTILQAGNYETRHRILSLPLSLCLVLMFIIGAQGQVMRFVVEHSCCWRGRRFLIYLTRVQPKKRGITHVQKKSTSPGDVRLEAMKCYVLRRRAGQDNLIVRAGARFFC